MEKGDPTTQPPEVTVDSCKTKEKNPKIKI